jgi:hypothetical protein
MNRKEGTTRRLTIVGCVMLVGCGAGSAGTAKPTPTPTVALTAPTPAPTPTPANIDPKLVDLTLAEVGAGYSIRTDTVPEGGIDPWERVFKGNSKTRFGSVVSISQVTSSSTQALILDADVVSLFRSKYPNATEFDLPAATLNATTISLVDQGEPEIVTLWTEGSVQCEIVVVTRTPGTTANLSALAGLASKQDGNALGVTGPSS